MIIYLETGSTDASYNLAFEQYVLEHCAQGDYLILWQNDNTIVIGQNQNAEEEINRRFVEEHQIHVVRRMTGGGAVYHDLGNLNYSFITDHDTGETWSRAYFTDPIVRALQSLGLQSEASGRNDILVNGRKVSGTAQRIVHGRILHHGTLLFDSDPEMIAGALHVDPSKFTSKSVKSVRSRVGNIRTELRAIGRDMSLSEFWAYLKKFLLEGGTEGGLVPIDLSEIQRLKEEKYDSFAWTYGRSPRMKYHSRNRFPGGSLEFHAEISEGRFTEVRFIGDFLGSMPLDDFESGMKGKARDLGEISSYLDQWDLVSLFGGIKKEEIIGLICG